MWYTLLLILLIVDALLLGTAVLLQAGQGGGLASLGGSGGTEMFVGGRQAVTILTKVTWWTGAIFLALALTLSGMSSRRAAPRSVLEQQIPPPAPVQSVPLPLEPSTPSAGAQPQGQTQPPPQQRP